MTKNIYICNFSPLQRVFGTSRPRTEGIAGRSSSSISSLSSPSLSSLLNSSGPSSLSGLTQPQPRPLLAALVQVHAAPTAGQRCGAGMAQSDAAEGRGGARLQTRDTNSYLFVSYCVELIAVTQRRSPS